MLIGTVPLNLADVHAFSIRFVKCPQNPEARLMFNDLYSVELDQYLELFDMTGAGRNRASALVIDNVWNAL